MGVTPKRYILQRKLARACLRLAYTGASVETIADELGFNDRSHFTKAFTRHMNIAPAAYRLTVRVRPELK
jgi:AraC family transcriptional regulator